MGSRGPAPRPDSSETKRRRNTMYRKTPAVPAGDIVAPESVTKVPAAAAFWGRTAPILIADGRLTADRIDAFAILCRLHAEIEQLADQVMAEGWITATDKGQAASPVAKLLRDSRRDFVTLARDFGLTAAAAARIPQEAKPDGEENDEEADVLRSLSVRG